MQHNITSSPLFSTLLIHKCLYVHDGMYEKEEARNEIYIPKTAEIY